VKELSIILPISKILDSYREKNFYFVYNYYLNHFPGAQIIIGKDDGNYAFFCKSRAINNAAKSVMKSYILIADIDIVPSFLNIREGINLLKLQNYAWIIPYNKIYKFHKQDSQKIIEGTDINSLNLNAVGSLVRTNPVTGGLQLTTKRNFDYVNGYDERFIGWGDEDICFCYSLKTLCGEGKIVTGDIYHLWHPRQASFVSRKSSEVEKNKNFQLRQEYKKIVGNKSAMMEMRCLHGNTKS